ncbi:MAG: lyase family protein, partial [Bacteroidota bacterium]
MRNEKDFLGEVLIPDEALYGIHAKRASENFANHTSFSKEWYCAVGWVKQACYQTAISFLHASSERFPDKLLPEGCRDKNILQKMEEAAAEVSQGMYFDNFIVPAVQGGAGTAINMNINEIIANVSLQKLGYSSGRYDIVDPFLHANLFQSTNDVIPTALKVAVMKNLYVLEDHVNQLRTETENLENRHRSHLRIAYTQMQQAVPSSFGMLFSAWSDALSRDWWRISKCFERIKVTNLGGGASGSGLSIPRYFIMEVTQKLRQITKMPVTRSENLTDTTQNFDAFVEVHAILKAHAVNLEKITSDLRLLGSEVTGRKEIELPRMQTGSSIMPGKVNPVINEFVISCAHKVYSNDVLISNLCGQGSLDLNPYIPLIGHAMLESLHLLIQSSIALKERILKGLKVKPQTAMDKLLFSPSLTTALLPVVGYNRATELALVMKNEG